MFATVTATSLDVPRSGLAILQVVQLHHVFDEQVSVCSASCLQPVTVLPMRKARVAAASARSHCV